MREAVFALVTLSLVIGLARALISIFWPDRRLWPPPENEAGWRHALGRFAGFGAALGVPAVALFDWNGFVFQHPSRFVVAALLLGFGTTSRGAYRHLGSSASVARPPAGGKLELVVDGPYRATRNPQYVGAIPAYLGIAVAANSGLALLTALLLGATLALMPFAEEPWLREKLGARYEAYAVRVPRFLGLSRPRER